MWYLGIEIELGIVGLCLEGDGLETGNSNIVFGVGGHQVCHCGLFIVGDGVVHADKCRRFSVEFYHGRAKTRNVAIVYLENSL